MTTVTLTERYISAVTRRLPADMQEDVREELAASVADDIEARIATGESDADAERAVLTGLGDPDALAAGFADRPLQLIGPKYYLTWWRLLKLLLCIVPFCVLGAVALGQSLAGAGIGEIIGSTAAATITATVHLVFWTTLVFAILDRTGADANPEWDLDSLPEPQTQGAGRNDVIASLVMLGLFAVLLLWDTFRGFIPSEEGPLSFLNPGLWPWALLVIIAFLVAEGALAVFVYRVGHWTTAAAVINTVLSVAFAGLALTLIARGTLVNPVFIDTVFTQNGVGDEVMHILGILLVFGIVGVAIWDIVDGWLKSVRAQCGVA